MKKYEQMSDKLLSVSVFEAMQIECESYHIDDGVIYKTKGGDWLEFSINNPSDIMPIAIENKISMQWYEDDDGEYCHAHTGDAGSSTFHDDENPYRAIAICILNIKDAEK